MNDFPNGHFKVSPGLNLQTHSYQPPQISEPSTVYNPATGAYTTYTAAHPAFAHPHPATRHVQQIQIQHSHLTQQQLQQQQHAQAQQQQQQQQQAAVAAAQQQQAAVAAQQARDKAASIQQQQSQRVVPPGSKSSDQNDRSGQNTGRSSPAEPQDLVKQKKFKSRFQDKAVETDHREDDTTAAQPDMFLEAKMEYESSVDDMEDTESRVREMKSDQNRKPCPECGKLLTNVREHIKSVHWQVKNFICDFCPYSTSFKRDLAKHRNSRHRHIIEQIANSPPATVTVTVTAPAPFIASKTPVQLPQYTQFRPVMPVHQPKLNPNSPVGAIVQGLPGAQPIQLQINPQNSGAQPSFPPGLNSITCPPSLRGIEPESPQGKGKRFKDCEQCGKAVINMNEHIRYVHRQEKNFSCTDCEYKTLFKCDLVKHQKAVHQKIRKVCSYCGKHVANLTEHIRFVHKLEKKNKCDNCNYACVKPSDLRKHVAAVHKWSRGILPTTIDPASINRKGEPIKVENR